MDKMSKEFPAKIVEFFKIISELYNLSLVTSLDQLISKIAVKTGFKESLLDGTPEGEGRWENVLELITVAEQIQANYEAAPSDDLEDRTVLDIFLEQVALVSDTDQINHEDGVVTLMTMHSAKGLEFQTVFIVGVEEGIFPHSRALMDVSEMEEERRLCYVGITRAKERLYMIYATERNIYGRFQCNPKSRFIENIPECLLDII
jgi:DNA helicase-2/ATP-dependent DNA helicase PcrA